MAHRVALMYAGQIIEVAERGRVLRRARSTRTRGCCCEALPDAAQARRSAGGDRAARCRRCGRRFDGCRFAPRCDRAFDALPRRRRPQLIDARRRAAVRCLLYATARRRAAPALRRCRRRLRRSAGGRGWPSTRRAAARGARA